MPSGRNFIVERVEDGMRKVVSEVTLSGEYLVLEEPDHVHFLIGSAEELQKFATEVNVSIPVTVEYDDEPKPKPRRKSTATKKSTAKKA